MAAGQQYRALFDFVSTGEGILSFKTKEQFTLVSKTDDHWWMVRSTSGEKGLAPISYLEPCPVRNGGPVRSAAYTTIYDYAAQETSQLGFPKGQTLLLIDKTDVSWWTMQTPDGRQGLVPVNYIDKLDTDNQQVPSTANAPSQSQALPKPPTDEDEGFEQVLASIDSNIARIHDEATNQGGLYTSTQKENLKKLVLHRQNFVQSVNKPEITTNHVQSNSSPSSDLIPPQLNNSPKKIQHQSPLPKRHAPPPPTSSPSKVTQSSSSPPKGSNSPRGSRKSGEQGKRQGRSKARQDSRHSMYVTSESNSDYLHYGSLPRRNAPNRSAPLPPNRQAGDATLYLQKQSSHEQQFNSLQRGVRTARSSSSINKASSSSSHSSFSSVQTSPPKSLLQVSPQHSPQRRNSESMAHRPPPSPQKMHYYSNEQLQELSVSSGNTRRTSASQATKSSSSSTSLSQNTPRDSGQATPSTPKQQRDSTPSTPKQQRDSTPSTPKQQRDSTLSTPKQQRDSTPSTPKQQRDSTPSTPKQQRDSTSSSTPKQQSPSRPVLPSDFSPKDGSELLQLVRKKAGITYNKAQQAVGGVLQFLKERAPACEEMVDALFNALEKAQSESSVSTTSSEQHSDLWRLREIFFEITECKDDSQQRGWAVHDDEKAISDLLEEMLQILCDANPEVSKVAIMEDKYENILTLITYYQMEPRTSIRLLLLKIFGVLCGLDRTIIGILLSSILPNELGRDIQQNMKDLQKTLYSSTVCTMIFSTAEAVPLSVYDQWDVDYVLFLMDTIEDPPPEDVEEQLPDAFLNMVLAFNQHFLEPASNLVMKALKQRPNPRNFSEKLMFLINREEDPVAIAEPCCPDSMTKFLLDVFSDRMTSGMFYTTDMRVLLDIVTRHLTNLCPGMENRTHYLELLYRIVGSTDYKDHRHRQRDLVMCLNRISNEEEIEGQADRELVKKIWMTYPQVFEEITDL